MSGYLNSDGSGLVGALNPSLVGQALQVDAAGNLKVALGADFMTNVKDWGAIGDGINDDTIPITNAINYVNGLGGGSVRFPAGTYITSTQLLYSKIHLIGAGIEATTIKLKSATNADLLQGSANGYGATMVNVGASNGTGSTGGVYNWSVQDMTLDGNKAGQSSGTSYCMRFYGFGYIIHNIRIKNGRSGGVLSDWNGGGTAGADSMESQWTNVKIHDCGSIGLDFGGPHDSQFSNVLIFNSGSTNFHIGPNATAILMSNCHGFSPGLGVSACSFLIEGGYGQYSNCVSEGSDTVNTVILAGDIEWIGSHIFGIVGNAALQQGGLQLGQQAGLTPFAGSVNQAAGVTTAWITSGCLVDGNFNMNNNFAINFANETNNVIRATCYNTSGVVITGTPNIQTSYEIYMNGLSADGTIGKGGGAYHAIKANKADTWGNRAQDTVNINTYTGKLEVVNGGLFIVYTDNYTTKSLETLSDAKGTIKFAGDAAATLAREAAGVLALGGTLALKQSVASAVIVNGDTLTISNVGVIRVNPGADVTGIIIPIGAFAGQTIIVVNESSHSVTFASSGTSHVADGVSDVIAANTAKSFVWDSSTSLWYPF
jgi:Pectate lyase superfamily protein